MSFIPIMEVLQNGTEALEKKKDERVKVDEEVKQEEEIEGTRSMIAKEGHQSLMAFFFCIVQIAARARDFSGPDEQIVKPYRL